MVLPVLGGSEKLTVAPQESHGRHYRDRKHVLLLASCSSRWLWFKRPNGDPRGTAPRAPLAAHREGRGGCQGSLRVGDGVKESKGGRVLEAWKIWMWFVRRCQWFV